MGEKEHPLTLKAQKKLTIYHHVGFKSLKLFCMVFCLFVCEGRKQVEKKSAKSGPLRQTIGIGTLPKL
jgi:hypothetical protein